MTDWNDVTTYDEANGPYAPRPNRDIGHLLRARESLLPVNAERAIRARDNGDSRVAEALLTRELARRIRRRMSGSPWPAPVQRAERPVRQPRYRARFIGGPLNGREVLTLTPKPFFHHRTGVDGRDSYSCTTYRRVAPPERAGGIVLYILPPE